MDRLKICMDALRALAQQQQLGSFGRTKHKGIFANSGRDAAKARVAIDQEAETSQHYITFWTTVQEFVYKLQKDEAEG